MPGVGTKRCGPSLRWPWLTVATWCLLCRPGLGAVTLPPVLEQELQAVTAQVVVRSSPCSAMCGLGLRTEELCLLGGGGVREGCEERKAECLVTWDCGLSTFTVTAGDTQELDCLGEVMETMGRFRFVFSWRYARGVVTTDDSFFRRYAVPPLDRLVLDPVREADAGTYRCDVKDSRYRMLKRVFFGVKVLPAKVVHLQYTGALSQWDALKDNQTGDGFNSTSIATSESLAFSQVKKIILYSLCISSGLAATMFLLLCCVFQEKRDNCADP
ncbi:TMM81 protein, partial [Atractosteus spatula]|nr:TMM81 protein [Atractosteus spatula]